jgi:hypothetical protein
VLCIAPSITRYHERKSVMAADNKRMPLYSRNSCSIICWVRSTRHGRKPAEILTNNLRFRCCQGSLAISHISKYSPEKERAEVMRGLDEDGWLMYLDNFQQTDYDLVAFLKIPALSERVRDRIASKIYNLPQDDSCQCNRWNRFRKYPLAKKELERYRSDRKVILHGLFPPTKSKDIELGIPQ